MSAWRVGAEEPTLTRAAPARRGAEADVQFGGGGPGKPPAKQRDETVKAAIDQLTKWIPGDALALYVAAVTAFAAADDARPSPTLLIFFVLLAGAFVVGGAFASTGTVAGTIALPAMLAAGAFAIWSLSVPFSGWQRWDLVSDNQPGVAVIAAVIGVLFGFVAEGLTKRAAH